jgi:hypothetical protein
VPSAEILTVTRLEKAPRVWLKENGVIAGRRGASGWRLPFNAIPKPALSKLLDFE